MDEKTQKNLAQVLETFIPLHVFLKVKVLEIREGYCKLLFPFRPELVGDPRHQRWHGGIISTALDAVGGAVGMTALDSWEDQIATIDMRVDFLRPSGPHDLIVEGEVARNGNRVIATRMWAYHLDQDEILAEGRAAYNVRRTPK